MTPAGPRPLDAVTSIKVKLGALVAASVVVAALVGALGSRAGVPLLLALPVAAALALGVTQLLAAGMVAPLREMTVVARRMARGDYSGRVRSTSSDEVGQLAAAFNTMAEDLATVDRERRDLVATVSHEIRTPLAALTALLDNLADGVVTADSGHLRQALAQAERLGALVSDLLELSRLDAGAARLDVRPVRLRPLVQDSSGQVAASGRAVRFDVRVPADLSVTGDPMRLRQLLTNALDNAARHSPEGGVVLVTAGETGDGSWLEIADTGPGVAREDRERAFDRFGTLAGDHGGGTGLGLAIGRWVATLHGGTLRFIDPLPEQPGARLRLELPLAPPDPTSPSPSEPATPAPSEEVPVSTTQTSDSRAGGPPPDDRSTEGARPLLETLFGRTWPEPPALPGAGPVVAAAVVGLLGGLLVTFRPPGLAWVLVLLAAGAAAWAVARHRTRLFTLVCTGTAALLVLTLALRAAEWLVPLCLLAAAAVFLAGVVDARSLFGFALGWAAWPTASVRGLPWFGRSLRVVGTGGRTSAVVRTIGWCTLGVTLFGLLFASADALFASWMDLLLPSLTWGDLVQRGFVALGVFGVTLAAAYLALNPPPVDSLGGDRPRPLGNRFEWLAPVLLVDVVFVVFLAAQAAAVFGGHDYVERTTGITYASYVHQGFGQLTVATALTLLVVWAASRRAGDGVTDRRWLLGSLGTLCLLTLVVVASALYRMHVYQEAYGFTRLRLLVDLFEGWLGLLVLAVMAAGVVRRGPWLPRFALLSAAAVVIGLVALNPDAWVAGRNIDRFEQTGNLDVDYLRTLSEDAAPVLAERLPAQLAACALAGPTHGDAEADDGVLSWNLGRSRADAVSVPVEVTTSTGCPGVLGGPDA